MGTRRSAGQNGLRGVHPRHPRCGRGRRVLLLNTPTQPVDSQLESAPLSTTVPVMTPQPVPVPPPETSATQTPTESPQTIESAPLQQTEAPQPTTSQRAPETHVTDSPTTRAPMSVAPRTRAPFPNQGGQRGGPNQGNLIPGVGLPGPL
jgi:hypothetical protein